jgi:hypothetical protein
VIKAGEILTYEVSFCKYTSGVPLLTRTFVDGIIYSIPDFVASDVEIGCRTNHIGIQIPVNLPVGVYVMRTKYRYQVNPVRFVEYVSSTEKFTVIK